MRFLILKKVVSYELYTADANGMIIIISYTVNHLNMARTLYSAITILPWIA